MKTIETVVVGGGQAGLAMSRSLLDRGHEHVVLERGKIAERWRSERWDSLRLLTPNWMSRLPGYVYRGADPDGFMSKSEVVDYLSGYARSFDAPVEQQTTVLRISPHGDGWLTETDRGAWRSRNVVIATGHNDKARIPAFAGEIDPSIHQMTTTQYRRPSDVPAGGVLVVGASASGTQLAQELRLDGRNVILAVGRHNRVPREYRGRDIMWWLDRIGILDRAIEDLPQQAMGMREPSLQLVGRRPDGGLDLGAMQESGVQVVGRAIGAERSTIHLGRDLERDVMFAEERLKRLVARIDEYAAAHGLNGGGSGIPSRIVVPDAGPDRLDLRHAGVNTVLWATGYRRDYSWLDAPVLDAAGEIRHARGRTPMHGLYVLGLQFMMRRRSSFIDGVGRDAEELANEITCHACNNTLHAA